MINKALRPCFSCSLKFSEPFCNLFELAPYTRSKPSFITVYLFSFNRGGSSNGMTLFVVGCFFFTPPHKTSVGQYGVIDNAANQFLIRKPKGFCLSGNDAELGQARNGIDLNDGATLTWNEHHVHTRQSAASH